MKFMLTEPCPLTSTVLRGQIWKSPNIAKTDRIGNQREEKFNRSIPFVNFFVLDESAISVIRLIKQQQKLTSLVSIVAVGSVGVSTTAVTVPFER